MEFGILDFLKIIGSLGFFIYGMKVMSEGIQKAAGNKMRQIMSAMTSNRFLGVFTGFLITAIIQSSSATTVMVVSFVNAGLLSLVESIGVIMGANIGTTITAWIVSIFGFKVKIAAIALPIIAIGFPMMFSSKSSIKAWAEFIIGFALLFMGLEALKSSVPDLKQSPEVLSFLTSFTGMGVFSLIIFIFIGTVLTIIVQSSSAAMALTLVMCNEGWIPFEMAAGMVLGENIGTTITAYLASLIGNVHAKRAARAHFVFNIFGVIWMIFAFNFYMKAINSYIISAEGTSPYENPHIIPIALSIFHTTFNISNTLILVWFVKYIEKAVIKLVPSKGESDEQYHLEYIGTGLMATPELSLIEVKKELIKYGEIDKRMLSFIKELLMETDTKKANEMLIKISKYENITDRIEEEVADYLLKVSEGEISNESSLRVRSMLSIAGDLERVGDILYQMSKSIERKMDEKVWFTPEQRNGLIEMIEVVNNALDVMIKNLKSEYEDVRLDEAIEMESQINRMRDKLRKEQFGVFESGQYDIKSGMIYTDLFSSLEKVGDHIINVTEAITGEI
jgi:phosphate:Na+ symporter